MFYLLNNQLILPHISLFSWSIFPLHSSLHR